MVRSLILSLVLVLAASSFTASGNPTTDKRKKEMKPQPLHSIVVRVEEAYDPYKDAQFDIAADFFSNRDKLPDPYVIVKYRPFLEDGTHGPAVFLGKTKVHKSSDLVKFDETIAYYGHNKDRPSTNGVVDVEVWDQDGLGLTDDFIGYVRVDLRDPKQYTGSELSRYRAPLIGAGYNTREYGVGFISFKLLAQVSNTD